MKTEKRAGKKTQKRSTFVSPAPLSRESAITHGKGPLSLPIFYACSYNARDDFDVIYEIDRFVSSKATNGP